MNIKKTGRRKCESTLIPDSIFSDERLKIESIGVLIYMISLNETTFQKIKVYERFKSSTTDQIDLCLKNLLDAGYIDIHFSGLFITLK